MSVATLLNEKVEDGQLVVGRQKVKSPSCKADIVKHIDDLFLL